MQNLAVASTRFDRASDLTFLLAKIVIPFFGNNGLKMRKSRVQIWFLGIKTITFEFTMNIKIVSRNVGPTFLLAQNFKFLFHGP
jgi:hypothetical protein